LCYFLYHSLYINSTFNLEGKQNRINEVARSNAALAEWNYDEFSDVDTKDEKYPIVVLRTGYKIIRFGHESSLIGWVYEIMNTSPESFYEATVTFKILDQDRFLIEEGEGKTGIRPGSYGTVQDTISVANDDLSRITNSSWTIQLSPDWMSMEKETKGKRYDRLCKIIREKTPSANLPFWAYTTIQGPLSVYSEKWKAIQSCLGSDASGKMGAADGISSGTGNVNLLNDIKSFESKN